VGLRFLQFNIHYALYVVLWITRTKGVKRENRLSCMLTTENILSPKCFS